MTTLPVLGSLKPKVGTRVRKPKQSSLLDALFPKTKQRVLALLYGQPDRAFGTAELIRLAGAGSGAVQREVQRLVTSGLVETITEVGQKRLVANRNAPIFEELRAIVDKTSGVVEVLRRSLQSLESTIRFAILYGSVAKKTDRATSDLDLLIVGDKLTLEAVYAALEPAEQRLGRIVSPTVYSRDEFRRRRAANNPFLTNVLGGPHVVLFGSEDAIAAR